MSGTSSSSSDGGDGAEMIPEDLLFHILLWLPVASLLRFKSVCKSWLSHIESSNFVSQHTRCSNSEDNQENKLITADSSLYGLIHNVISVLDLQLNKYVDFNLNTDTYVTEVMLVSSFDGIICLKHRKVNVVRIGNILAPGSMIDVVSLMNPAMRHFKILPPPLAKYKNDYIKHNSHIDYGFGFDAQTNDYKVVRVELKEDKEDGGLFKSHIEVYSLNTDSWRIIDAFVPENVSIAPNSMMCLSKNGVYYWLARTSQPIILSFDFGSEVFGVIEMDEAFASEELQMLDDDQECEYVFAFLRDKLACIHWVPNSSDMNCHCDVWVLEESWIKLHTIMLDTSIHPLGIAADGKIVLMEETEYDSENQLVLCDPVNKNFTYTPFQGVGTPNIHVVYKESLVSVESLNGETCRVDKEV